ncbi:MAG: hypothetical protein VX835_00285 [Pseudomonadota bacterium]|nr:hypothetical protein [Pseudomonadota bacterium]
MAKKSDSAFYFYLSSLDLIVELFYKWATNARILFESGGDFPARFANLILTLVPFAIHKINGYWNQYFNPSDPNSKWYRINQYVANYLFPLFIIGVVYVISCKLLVDFRHIKVTVIGFIVSKISAGFYLNLFFNVFVLFALLESLISSTVDWYINYTGKKVDKFLELKWFVKPIKIKLQRAVDLVRISLSSLTSLLETGYYGLLLYFKFSFPIFCVLCPLLAISGIYSTYIKTSVNNWQNVNNGYCGKPSLFKEIFTLFMFSIMVVSPFVQFDVILGNMAIFLGVATTSPWAYAAALCIAATFVMHKFVQKGDQVYKYLYGVGYADNGYTMLGGLYKCEVDKTLQKVKSSESLIQELDTKVYSKLSLKLDGSTAARTDDEADLLTPFKTARKQ